jgi:DNA-binding MarR family transcriptional regulator
MSRPKIARIATEMAQECLNMRARLVSRVVSGIFDDALREIGVKSSQLDILAAIASTAPVRRTDIGRYMHLDASTLTRNLRVMETNGWIEDVPEAADGRGAPVRLTDDGENLLERALPAWREAQRAATQTLGREGRAALVSVSKPLLP